jgi:hypothetical protein
MSEGLGRGGSVEPQLIEAARRGDREAFDAIVRLRLDTGGQARFDLSHDALLPPAYWG